MMLYPARLAPSSPVGTSYNTPWFNVYYIDSHNLSCPPSTAMAQFKLNVKFKDGGFRDTSFTYSCVQVPGVAGTAASGTIGLGMLKDLPHLDQINMSCSKNTQVIQAWKFERFGNDLYNPQARIRYTCTEFNTPLSCRARVTGWKTLLEFDVGSLNPHDVTCRYPCSDEGSARLHAQCIARRSLACVDDASHIGSVDKQAAPTICLY